MPHTQRYVPTLRKAWFAALSTLLVLPACGLGMDNADRLERGQQAYESADYRAAIIDAKNILINDPDNVDARLLLGRSSLRIGDPRSAEKELRRAVQLGADKSDIVVDLGRTLLILREFEQVEIEITADNAADEETRIAVLRMRGDALLGQQRVAEARAIYTEILAVRNDDLDTMLAVVTSYVVQNQLLQARATLDQILTIDPEYIAGWLASGSLAALQHNLARAEVNFAKGAELAAQVNDMAGHVRGLTGVVETQLAQGKSEEARLTTARLTELAPQNPFNQYLAARVSYLEADWAAADESLGIMLRQFPDFVPARVLKGAVQLKRGNLGQAEVYLSTVVYAEPENLLARKLLAEVRLQQNRAAEASQVLQPILSGESVDAAALAMAVRASLGTGKFDEAIRYLRIRAAAEPDNPNMQMDLAMALLSAGEIEEGQGLLRDLPIVSENDDYRREFLLVLAEVRRNNWEQALVAAREMQKQWTNDARLQNLLGGILDAAGDRVAARQSFENARALDPSDSVSLINLGRLDIIAGNFESAYQLYEQALAIQPQNVGIMVSLGRIAASKGDGAAAISWLEKARAADESNVSSRLMLGKLYLTGGDFVAAEEVTREAIALNKDIADLHNTFGLAVSANNEHETALHSFSKAIELNPNEPGYSINLAHEHFIGKDEERALDVLFDSLRSKPDHTQTAMMLAAMIVQAGNAAKALPAARDLQQNNPGSVGPKVLLAELYYGDEQFGRGADLYDEALELSGEKGIAIRAHRLRAIAGQATPVAPLLKYLASRPEDTLVRMLLAQEYQSKGDNNKAAAEYRKIVDAAPGNYVALNNLALIYVEQGNAEAETLARKASELAPQNGAIMDTLGWILVQTGSTEEGVEYLRQASELIRTSLEIRYHLAVGLAESGATDEARNLLTGILSIEEGFSGREDAEALLSSL